MSEGALIKNFAGIGKAIGDMTSIGAVVLYWVTEFSSLLLTLASLVWVVLRIYEMETVQQFLKQKKK